jgi:hypothetical protein
MQRTVIIIDGDGDGPGPDVDLPPTLREFLDETQPAEMKLELRQTSTEDFFAMVGALKDAKATAAVTQIQVGLAQEACAMRLGSDVRLSGEGVAAVVQAIRNAVANEDAVVTAQMKAVSFPTGRDLIAFVETMKVEVGDPRECVTQPQTRRA